ncbi:Energy-coupling factor transporter ATP-binding protein EcfA3 [compost metagenome]
MGIRDLRNLILQLREEYGITFFISSHLLDELQRMCDRFVIIREGNLVWQGTKEEWLKEAGTQGLEDHFVEMMTSR